MGDVWDGSGMGFSPIEYSGQCSTNGPLAATLPRLPVDPDSNAETITVRINADDHRPNAGPIRTVERLAQAFSFTGGDTFPAAL